jgi:hypothetical protein
MCPISLGELMRLGGWTRIGIVLTAIWIVVGWFYAQGVERDRILALTYPVYKVCTDNRVKQNNYDFTGCMQEADRHIEQFVEHHSGWYSLGIVLLPIPFAWLFVYISVLVTRWIKRGFVQSPR